MITVIVLKMELFYHAVMCSIDAAEMADSVAPDQTKLQFDLGLHG